MSEANEPKKNFDHRFGKVDYSPKKDVLQEKQERRFGSNRLVSPENSEYSYKRQNFESDQIDKKDNLTEYSLPNSNYPGNMTPNPEINYIE
jgi:hypothetical protein